MKLCSLKPVEGGFLRSVRSCLICGMPKVLAAVWTLSVLGLLMAVLAVLAQAGHEVPLPFSAADYHTGAAAVSFGLFLAGVLLAFELSWLRKQCPLTDERSPSCESAHLPPVRSPAYPMPEVSPPKGSSLISTLNDARQRLLLELSGLRDAPTRSRQEAEYVRSTAVLMEALAAVLERGVSTLEGKETMPRDTHGAGIRHLNHTLSALKAITHISQSKAKQVDHRHSKACKSSNAPDNRQRRSR